MRSQAKTENTLQAAMLRGSITWACVMLAGTEAFAQGVLTGVVREDATARVLAGVEVLIEGTQRQTRTDSAGRYVLIGPAGDGIARFRSVGFSLIRKRVTLRDGDTARVDATLSRQAPPELDTVRVRERPNRLTSREAFWERRALGLGKFLDSTELRKMDGRRMAEVLREVGVRIVRYSESSCGFGCTQEERAAGSGSSPDGSPGCWATVIFDGMIIYRSRSSMRPPDFRADFPVSSLEAIEYYRSSSITPMEFSARGADCGVLVLWSRRAR